MKPLKIDSKAISQKAEQRLLEAMNRTDMEKFEHLMFLIKTQQKMSKATIVHKD